MFDDDDDDDDDDVVDDKKENFPILLWTTFFSLKKTE